MDVSDGSGTRVHLAMPRRAGRTVLAEEILDTLRADGPDQLTVLGQHAATISRWLDEEINLPAGPALILCRVSKCANESGEALDALEKALGINPRKGVCGTLDEVRKELLDVALTALGAYEHLTDAQGQSAYALLNHARTRLERVGLLVDG